MKSQCHIISLGANCNSIMLHSNNAEYALSYSLEEGSLILDTGVDVDIESSIVDQRHCSGKTYNELRAWTHPRYRRIYMTDEGSLVFGMYIDPIIDRRIA